MNENYGEPFGDMVLGKIADSIRAVYRPEDVAVRLQNDDFAVLMPDTAIADARILARKLKDRLSLANFTYRGSTIQGAGQIGVIVHCKAV